jgi:hypothetical protein
VLVAISGGVNSTALMSLLESSTTAFGFHPNSHHQRHPVHQPSQTQSSSCDSTAKTLTKTAADTESNPVSVSTGSSEGYASNPVHQESNSTGKSIAEQRKERKLLEKLIKQNKKLANKTLKDNVDRLHALNINQQHEKDLQQQQQPQQETAHISNPLESGQQKTSISPPHLAPLSVSTEKKKSGLPATMPLSRYNSERKMQLVCEYVFIDERACYQSTISDEEADAVVANMHKLVHSIFPLSSTSAITSSASASGSAPSTVSTPKSHLSVYKLESLFDVDDSKDNKNDNNNNNILTSRQLLSNWLASVSSWDDKQHLIHLLRRALLTVIARQRNIKFILLGMFCFDMFFCLCCFLVVVAVVFSTL